MLVSEAIAKAYLTATGKTTALAVTDPKWLQLFALADLLQKDWQDQPGVDWMSLYFLSNIGTIAESTGNSGTVPTLFSIGMDPTMRKVSQRENDSVVLLGTDGTSTWNYEIIRPDQLVEFSGRQACAAIQGDLFFATQFLASDARLGASITVPGFGFVPTIANADGDDTIVVDDPMWMVYMMAAELVRTDLVRQNQYPNILAKANDRMQAMIEANSGQIDEIPVDMDTVDYDPNYAASAWY